MNANQRYFRLQQDRKYHDFIGRKAIHALQIDWQYDSPVFCMEDRDSTIGDRLFCPFIEAGSFIVTSQIKMIFEAHCSEMLFRPCIIGVLGKLPQELCYAVNPKRLPCVSTRSQYDKAGNIRELVLNQHKIGPHRVFQVEGTRERILIVNLEVLEELMDTECFPIVYEEVMTTIDYACTI